jgi:DNA (cytosine-5)-methyltransferase 1
MKFGSVCSGIEAASVAWHPLGWRAAWLAEIEPFPSAVLAHHYPDVPNLGDMTTLPERILSGEVEAPDVFCGGTPCQAFSVAGLRKSLDDARGNLSLTFCEIANAIDHVRSARGEPASIVFWENVPGVLSTKDNAFGCFLAGLAGEDGELEPAGGKWTNAGYVLGPKRAVAWRVLDAQYFGVAQRRRRVFVIASAQADFDPAAVLFEFGGVRRDTAPSREAGEGVAHATAPCLTGSGRGVERTGDTRGQDPVVAVTCMAHGQGGAEIATDRAPTLTCNHEAPIALAENIIGRQPHNGGNGDGFTDGGPMYTLTATGVHGVAQPIAFHPTQDPISSTDGTTHGLGCGSSGGQASAAISYGIRTAQSIATHHVAGTMMSYAKSGGDSNRIDNAAGGYMALVPPSMAVRRLIPVECERLQGFPDNYTQIPWRKKPASECPDGPRYKALGNSWAVPVVAWIGIRINARLHRAAQRAY